MVYKIRLKDGSRFELLADTIKEPNEDVSTSKIRFYVFELDGDVVAKYRFDEVVGWMKTPYTRGQ